ncbi:hypothetical protein FYC62_01960 [Pedobacter aquae]|uniref:PEP-CTERM protein-sorting domain-containing protein n=1 Tax=Pedobacter aquae TaxID=2605747 RepID=A0A5C0VCR0_9SPHI|nr:hypothetical protein [Pedobacter aquae]QEK50568.1 hypothetical protein FYC62_01960 [Pedobacter aquae]
MKSIKTSKLHMMPFITLAIGILLMVFTISVEDEPGALPLFLVLISLIWLIINWFKVRKKQNNT